MKNTLKLIKLFGLAVLLVCVFAAADFQVTAVSQPKQMNWERNIEFSNDNLRGITAGNGIYVAVGETGALMVSADKTNWKPVASNITNILTDVIWDGREFIAVGKEGTIITSKGGVHWTRQKSNSTGALRSIAYSGSLYIIVGDAGECLISKDAVHWEKKKPFKDSFLRQVIWTGDKFAVVCATGGLFYTSTDGLNWNSSTLNRPFYSVCWNGERFVAVGNQAQIRTSKDGITWNISTLAWDDSKDLGLNNISFNKVVWGNGHYIAVGSAGTIVASKDGITWAKVDSKTNNQLWAAYFDGKDFISVGNNKQIVRSGDAYDWVKVTQGLQTDFNDICYTRNRYVIVGSNGTILSSKDAVNWLKCGFDTGKIFNAVAYGNGMFVTVGYKGEMSCSKDGTKWIPLSTVQKNDLFDIATNGKVFAVIGKNILLTSPDGIKWTVNHPPFDTDVRDSIIWDGNKFVVTVQGTVYTSRDAVKWSELTNSKGYFFRNAIKGKGKYLAFNSGRYYISADLKKWEEKYLAAEPYNISSMIWDGKFFKGILCSGWSGIQNKYVESSDGINWTTYTFDSSQLLLSSIWDGKNLIAVGGFGAIIKLGK